MAKKCPQCGRSNDNAMHFCAYCTAALDSDVKLLMDLENRGKKSSQSYAYREDDGDEELRPVSRPQKKSSSALPLLLVAVAAVAVWFFFFR